MTIFQKVDFFEHITILSWVLRITLEQADQYKLEFATAKALRAKATSDHLSV